MNEKLEQQLLDTLTREQDKYRDWLKSQPPEEILHHAYEYAVREDILMSMEDLTLSEAQTRALLLSPSPLAVLYDKYSDLETGYMDTIRDSIEDTAKAEANRLRDLPVYPHPAAYAREHSELAEYRASLRANISCRDAIETAIREHYRDNRLGVGAVGQVTEQFGQERTLYVLAATVRHFDYDGRISRDNKGRRYAISGKHRCQRSRPLRAVCRQLPSGAFEPVPHAGTAGAGACCGEEALCAAKTERGEEGAAEAAARQAEGGGAVRWQGRNGTSCSRSA